MSFGAISSPRYRIQDMEIVFEVLNDPILEGTERGRIQIAPDPNLFAEHGPLFGNVIIVLRDDESKILITRIDTCRFSLFYLQVFQCR